MTISRLLPLFVVGNLVTGCQSPAPAPLGSNRQEIIGGEQAFNDKSTGYLLAYQGQDPVLGCTATIVSPRYAITAAHCLTEKAVGADATFDIFIGQDSNNATETGKSLNWIPVKTVHPDPVFDMSMSALGHDVGLVELQEETTLTPIPLGKKTLDDSIKGTPLRLIGYGETTVNDPNTTGARYQTTTAVSYLDEVYLGSTALDHRYCHGDSGGPALIMEDGEERLVGIVSHWQKTSPTQPDCTGTALYTRIDTASEFLASYLSPPSMDAGTSDAAMAPMKDPGGCSVAAGSSATGLGALALLLIVVVASLRQRETQRHDA